jgi:hypothetical protein
MYIGFSKIENKSGKEHSLKYEELDINFAKYLRQNYYNVYFSNQDCWEIRKKYLEELCK